MILFFKWIKNIFFFYLLLNCSRSYAQSYGLSFFSHGVIQDKRTSLDLSPDKTLRFDDNFELSFDLSLVKIKTVNAMYYGYVTRIIEDDKRNIDIVYNTVSDKNCFNVIIGGGFTKIEFKIGQDSLYKKWNKFRIKFDFDNDRLIVYAGNKAFIQSGLRLKKHAFYKIVFGANNYKQFQTTDLPPMKLRDIKIVENNKLKYYWPLDEMSGAIAHEHISQNDALVYNPEWMLAKHYNWQLEQSLKTNGVASVAFDSKKEMLYIVASDSLYVYSVNNSKWNNRPLSNKLILSAGNQSVYDPYNNSLYNFFIDNNLVKNYDPVNKYNPETLSWYKSKRYLDTYRWQVNSMISKDDTSLYLFGGYGHHIYKNTISQFSFKSQTWKNLLTTGDFFIPRYLAALGSSLKGDTAYILGGYGDSTGQQVLNPKNLYDMMRFTVKDKKFKKLFDLKTKEDFTFANSLVINDIEKKYYALIFPRNRYNSNLQLITGSLTNANYNVVGSQIPYVFHDTHSFADLYYAPVSSIFIAVTILRDENGTSHANVYTLLSPLHGLIARKNLASENNVYLYIAVAGSLLSVLSFFILRKLTLIKRKGLLVKSTEINIPYQTKKINNDNSHEATPNTEPLNNFIFLFGHLQLLDTKGTDLTKYFSPILKDLFVLILLYTIKYSKGISSENINAILWPDKSTSQAGNNRSVNILKLKSILNKISYCQIIKEKNYWKIEVDYGCTIVDYKTYLSIISDKKKLDKEKLMDLASIIKRGSFLSGIENEWLDDFKSELSNEVIDIYLHFSKSNFLNCDPEFLIELAGYLSFFDPVNEEAMAMKCKALASLGRHLSAKNSFEIFCKEYRNFYGEEFGKNFCTILA